MDSTEQRFRHFLRQRKLKYTNERISILKAAENFGRPFEAEELLLTLRESEQRTSKATVYRTLKHLLEAGLLKQIYFGTGKQSHYDFVGPATEAPNVHLLDLDTGRIVPFVSEALIKLRNQIAIDMGFDATGHRFQIIARRRPNS